MQPSSRLDNGDDNRDYMEEVTTRLLLSFDSIQINEEKITSKNINKCKNSRFYNYSSGY